MKRLAFARIALAIGAISGLGGAGAVPALAAPAKNSKLTDPRRGGASISSAHPNPAATLNQLIYTGLFGKEIASAVGATKLADIIRAISTGDFGGAAADLRDIASIDPIARLLVVLAAHQNLPVHPFGYYATVVLADKKVGAKGWTCPDPEGNPYGDTSHVSIFASAKA